jgi:hypothetical protein
MSIGAISPNSPSPTPARDTPPVQTAATSETAAAAPSSPASTTNLTPEALKLVDQLKARDTEVRQHEQAHLATAGGLAVSGASYTYERGPNGVSYAIGGEVHIDTSPGGTPEETIARARTIQAAALAPADPSGADRSVAAQAQQMETQARAELAQQQTQAATGRVQSAYGARQQEAPKLDVYA